MHRIFKSTPIALAALLAMSGAPAQGEFSFDACFSRCMEVSRPSICSRRCGRRYTIWKWRQLHSVGDAADAQSVRRPLKRRTTIVAASYQKFVVPRSMFSGSESRIATMNFVNADCSPGPLPNVRVVTQPSNGELRMEPIKYAVNRQANDVRAHCNGKIVDAVAVFYKSREQYVGADKAVLEVDFKHGTIHRYTYAIDVR